MAHGTVYFLTWVVFAAIVGSVTGAGLQLRRTSPAGSVLKVGAILDRDDNAAAAAFEAAVEAANQKDSGAQRFEARVFRIARNNAVEANASTCALLSEGVIVIFTDAGSVASQIVQRISEKHQIPHLTVQWSHDPLNIFSINLRRMFENFGDEVSKALKTKQPLENVAIISADPKGADKFADVIKKIGSDVSFRKWPSSPEEVASLMASLKRKDVRRIVADIPRKDMREFLLAVKNQGMDTKDHYFLFTAWDASDTDPTAVGVPMTATLRVLSLIPELPQADLSALRKAIATVKKNPLVEISENAALIYEGVLLLANAVKKLTLSVPVSGQQISCSRDDVWEGGTSLLNYLKMDTSGSADRSGRVIVKRQTKFETLRVVTLPMAPYAIMTKKKDNSTGWDGLCIRILKVMAEDVGFKYKINEVADNRFGILRKGKWNGMIGDLVNNKADIAVAPLTVTTTRSKFVDFLHPFKSIGIKFIMQKPVPQTLSPFSFIQPLTPAVWIVFLIAFVLVSLVLFVIAKLSPYEWGRPHHGADVRVNHFSLLGAFWFAISGCLRQYSGIAPRSTAARMVAGMWWVVVLLFFLLYVINLVPFLKMERIKVPTTFEELVKSGIRYGVLRNSATERFFKDSDIEFYQLMWKKMSSTPGSLKDSYRQGIRTVHSGNYAFIGEEDTLDSIAAKNSSLFVSSDSVGYRSFAFAVRDGLKYKKSLNDAILKMFENSEMEMLRRLYSVPRKYKEADVGYSAFSMNEMGGVFVLLVIGLILGLIVAVLEYVWKRCCKRTEGETPTTPLTDVRGSLTTTKRSVA